MSITAIPAAQDTTRQLVASLWTRTQALVLVRLDVLDRAADDASKRRPSEALAEEALAVAHKLAGSLGMFGFPKGTHIAREIEQLLESQTPDPRRFKTLTIQLREELFPN